MHRHDGVPPDERTWTHWTLAVTVAVPVSVNEQDFALAPPLEQAPEKIASRLFDTLSVTTVPVANDAAAVPPATASMPTGLEVTCTPVRPVTMTVNVAAAAGGRIVNAAVRVTPAAVAEMVATVDAVTGTVVMVNSPLVAPAATVTLAGIVAMALSLESVTANPPAGAAEVNVTVP